VAAGRSSWTKIHAVAEMIRLAGTPVVSAVLVDADKTDESIGMPPTPPMPLKAQDLVLRTAPGSPGQRERSANGGGAPSANGGGAPSANGGSDPPSPS